MEWYVILFGMLIFIIGLILGGGVFFYAVKNHTYPTTLSEIREQISLFKPRTKFWWKSLSWFLLFLMIVTIFQEHTFHLSMLLHIFYALLIGLFAFLGMCQQAYNYYIKGQGHNPIQEKKDTKKCRIAGVIMFLIILSIIQFKR